jgi:hypothetical protein
VLLMLLVSLTADHNMRIVLNMSLVSSLLLDPSKARI